MSIIAENLTWRIGRKTIVDDVSLVVEPGKVLGLLGPNGSGKSSLLRLLSGLRRPDAGRVLLEGREISRLSRRALARRMALVQQHATTDMNVTVQEVVKLGRTPHRGPLSGWSRADQQAVDTALAQVGMTAHRQSNWQNLSGGERQRAHIARALAQAPSELFLDEPTNHLDVQHQIELMRLIAQLRVTSIVALHDLNHAAMFCDNLAVMQSGRIVAAGTPEKVLTRELLREVFRVDCDFHRPAEGGFHILFRKSSRQPALDSVA